MMRDSTSLPLVQPQTDQKAVADFRISCLDNGYSPLAVYTGKKNPVGEGWQQGHSQTDLLPPRKGRMNTGILTAGFQAVDIDIDNPAIAGQIRTLAEDELGATIVRGREGSSRALLLYRAADGEPGKASISSTCHGERAKIEILGRGQQFVAHGTHPEGAAYVWENGQGPHTVPAAELPAVTVDQVAAFLAKAQPIIRADAVAKAPDTSKVSAKIIALPGRKPPSAMFAGVWAKGAAMTAAMSSGVGRYDALDRDAQGDVVAGCIGAIPNSAPPDWNAYKVAAMRIYAMTTSWPDQATAGLEAFCTWSKKNPCHDDGKAAEVWREVLKSPPSQIGPGSFILEALNHGAVLHAASSAAIPAPNAFHVGTLAPTTVVLPTWATLPPTLPESTAAATLNHLLGFAHRYGSSSSYYARATDGIVRPITPTEGANMLAPYRVQTGSGADMKTIPAWKWWTSSIQRRTVDAVAYDPESKLQGGGQSVENTWQGFAVQATPGSWRRIRWHLLRVICNGSKPCFKFLMCWLAHTVQRPGTAPESMVVLRSDREGAGKSTVGKLLISILGRHGYEAASLAEVFGQFNEAVADKSFVLLEENAFPGDHRMSNNLKAVITAGTLNINPKGRPVYSIPNTLHLMLATNERWAVPAGADARRFLVLDVRKQMPRTYFDALYREIESGGIGAFLYALLRVNLTGFNPRQVPATAALVQQQRLSGDDISQWISDTAMAGVLVPGLGNGGFSQDVSAAQLHGAYRCWMECQGRKRPMTAVAFGRELGQLGMVRRKSNGSSVWAVPDHTTLLRNSDDRAGIRKPTA